MKVPCRDSTKQRQPNFMGKIKSKFGGVATILGHQPWSSQMLDILDWIQCIKIFQGRVYQLQRYYNNL